MKLNSFAEVYIKLIGLGLKNQKELAGILGLAQSSISDAKRRNKIPNSWILILCKKYKKSPEWFLSSGSMAEPIGSLHDLIKGFTDMLAIIREMVKEYGDRVDRLERQVEKLKKKK